MIIKNCPYCGFLCECDEVNVGIGMVQAGPYCCENCGATQIGPYDKERELTEKEKETGWYFPGSEPGSSANVINGKVVSHKQMMKAYRDEFTDNPLWIDKSYADDWYKNIRKKQEAPKKSRIDMINDTVDELISMPKEEFDALLEKHKGGAIARFLQGFPKEAEG